MTTDSLTGHFESACRADQEVWLAAGPDATEVRERLDQHRARWMSYRGVPGMAYLTPVPVRGRPA
ncbi:hypothetical protein ACFWN1_04640 [Streptomyces sp. NPDC058459]|uniref:hypothetical protein n=1 Tax=Streptomyces sp. NPDC058459 TaxID=3346508 RepID=UPI0036633270